ncbi:MAG TPA: hypothetical protein VF274_00625, partial [Alphaproteobacteria bacterium]
ARLAALLSAAGLRPPFDAAELRRAAESKRNDISDLRQKLGVSPRPFAEGVRLKIERGWVT